MIEGAYVRRQSTETIDELPCRPWGDEKKNCNGLQGIRRSVRSFCSLIFLSTASMLAANFGSSTWPKHSVAKAQALMWICGALGFPNRKLVGTMQPNIAWHLVAKV